MNKSVIRKWLFTFGTLIILPAIIFVLTKNESMQSVNEKRNLAEKPQLQITNLQTYATEYEEYFNDHLPLRDALIQLNSLIDYYVFNRSSSDSVIVGREGWLFYTGNERINITDYYGEVLYTEEELEMIKNNLIDTEQKLRENGKEFVVFIAPNKESIYGEQFFPKSMGNRGEISKARQLVKYLYEETELRVVYPEEELQYAMSEYPEYFYYYKLDSHWNELGGYIGAKALLDELGVYLPEISQVEIKQNTNSGRDLVAMLNLTNFIGEDTNFYVENYTENEFETWDQDSTFYYKNKSENVDERNIMIIRDSYTISMRDYIGANFNESCMPYRNSYTPDMIVDENPDIVVYQTVERYLDVLKEFVIVE